MPRKPDLKTSLSQRNVLILIAISLVYFLIFWRKLLLDSLMPFDGNTIRLFYPSWIIGKDLLTEGFYFLWDPYRNFGQPFLAAPQNQALYPIRLLSIFLSYLDYQRLFIVFHTLLASTFGFLIAKDWFKKGILPALFVAVTIGFNGFFISRVSLLPHFASMAWIPAVLYFHLKRKSIPLGLTMALQWLAGFPPFFILTLVIQMVFVLASEKRKGFLITTIKGWALAGGLAAVQLIPFLELISESARPVFLKGSLATQYSLHPIELIRNLLVPSVVLNSLDAITTSDQAIIGFYLGPVFLALFFWGWIKGKKREKRLALWSVIALLLALGKYTKIYTFIPFITFFRFPANWALVAIVPMILVATYGLLQIRSRKIQWALLVVVAFDLLLFASSLKSGWADSQFFSNTSVRIKGLQSIPKDSRVFHTHHVTEHVHRWKLESEKDWIFFKALLTPSVGPAFGIKEAASFYVLPSKKHISLLRQLNLSEPKSVLLDQSNISKIVTVSKEGMKKEVPSWEDFRVVENSNFKPKAFLLNGGQATLRQDKPGHISVEAKGPGPLVLSETYFPGWKVKVNQEKYKPKMFGPSFMSVDLSAGDNKVDFVYQPASVKWGFLISIFSLFFILRRRF